MLLGKERTPRWIIFFLDIGICLFSLSLAYLLRFNFSIPEVEYEYFIFSYPALLLVRIVTFFIAKIYKGIIRYTSTRDAQRILLTVTTGSIILAIINLIRYYGFDQKFVIPFSVIIIDYLATTFMLICMRIAVKVFYLELKNPTKEKSNVIIFGAGEAGVISKRTIDRDRGSRYKVLTFVDDDTKKAGNNIEGIKVNHTSKLDQLLRDNNIHHVIISIQNLNPKRKAEVAEICLANNVYVLDVPPASSWINGELSFKQIRKVNIVDLLGRDPIKLDEKNIRQQLDGKVVLITGAAGSIGSELTRQIARFSPKQIILVDQAESPLYELELEISAITSNKLCEVVVGDIRNHDRMENVFKTFGPEVVYHAAAYKHVPIMEHNPSEAVRTNILGTKIIADLAIEFGVKDFILVSTDKAVNPTNVMGASKRVAEIYTQSINNTTDTKFITTRFGNVLGSNGSVIPLFTKQIEKGGPITVTDKEVTRFFMTIPEACQLVLEAGSMGNGGEIYIFDMGDSVKIYDLAKNMIKLSGLKLGKDIQITFTGLRPGEKLYEELLADNENTIETHHPQIMIIKVREYSFDSVSNNIDELIALYQKQENEIIVGKMKEIVPEFISKNSEFSKLDAPATKSPA